MVLAGSRAASGVSSTATRAPGPCASFVKSIFNACSRRMWKCWSYETLTSRKSNQPCTPLPQPSICAWLTIWVHMVALLYYACDGRHELAEVSFQEIPDLLPAIDRLLLPVGGPVIVEEPVASTIIPVEL